MLQDPKFCPQCGSGLEIQHVADRDRPVCPDCGFVFYLNPIVAAGTLVEQDGRVALVQRGVEPGRGRWGLPSGYVELGESAEEAAVRETFEESHLQVEIDGLLDAFSFNGPQSQGVLLIYAAHAIGGELAAGDDAVDAAWFGPDELPRAAFSTHREVLRRWRQARTVAYGPATLAEAEVVTMLSQLHDFGYGQAFAPYVGDDDWTFFVARDQDQVVGFAVISLAVHDRTAQIHGIFVIPRYRRWGIGTCLIETCLEWAQSQERGSVITYAPIGDLGWTVYVKTGFRVSGFTNDYYAPNAQEPVTALILSRDLGHA